MSRVHVAARALRKKFGLLSAFGTVWPAAVRGGRLLARGRFREFGRKLFNEMDDVRAVDAMTSRPGPRLFLAGHVLGLGGYDHVVRAVLKGLTDSGIDVCRDLRALIRGGASDDELEAAVRTVWGGRADRYSDLRSAATAGLDKVEMSYIGG